MLLLEVHYGALAALASSPHRYLSQGQHQRKQQPVLQLVILARHCSRNRQSKTPTVPVSPPFAHACSSRPYALIWSDKYPPVAAKWNVQ